MYKIKISMVLRTKPHYEKDVDIDIDNFTKKPLLSQGEIGASDEIRTHDNLVGNEKLYH